MKTQKTKFKETDIGLIPEEWRVLKLELFAQAKDLNERIKLYGV